MMKLPSILRPRFERSATLRHLVQLLGVVVVLSLLIFGAIAFGRASTNYGCLHYDSPHSQYSVPVYDLHSGAETIGIPGVGGAPNNKFWWLTVPRPADRRLSSPNGKFVARLSNDDQSMPTFVLDLIDPAEKSSAYPSTELTLESGGVTDLAWTSDNMLVYVGYVTSSNLLYVARANPQTGERHIVPHREWQSSPALSPDGQYLALLDFNAAQGNGQATPPTHVTLLATSRQLGDSNEDVTLPQFDVSQGTSSPASIVHWAPDSRHLAVLRPDPKRQDPSQAISIDILGVDGMAYQDQLIIPFSRTVRGDAFFPARWSANGQAMLFALNDKMMAFYADSQHLDVIADNLVYRPYYSFENTPFYACDAPGTEQMVIIRELPNRKLVAEMINTNGGDSYPLIQDADSIGRPVWLPDGQTVAVPWTQGSGDSQHAYITVGFAQQKDKSQLLDYGYQALEGIQWQEQYIGFSSQIIFVGHRDDHDEANLVDLKAGTRQTLGKGSAAIYDLHQDPGTAAINFWWKRADGAEGTDGYNAHGQLIYRFRATGVGPDGGDVYQSPDARTALLAVNTPRGTTYGLSWEMSAQWRVIRMNTTPPDDVEWTPDGTGVAFAYRPYGASTGDRTIEAVSTDIFNGYAMKVSQGWDGPGLAFSRCDEIARGARLQFNVKIGSSNHYRP